MKPELRCPLSNNIFNLGTISKRKFEYVKIVAGSVKIYSGRLGSSVHVTYLHQNERIRTEEPSPTEYILTEPYKVCLGTHCYLIDPRS